MKFNALLKGIFPGILLAASIVPAAADTGPSLTGTWTLVAADVQHPDGTRGRDYGADPRGLLMVDAKGRYSLQIFKSERSKFIENDKAKGTADEYKGAVMGASTHYGTIEVDPAKQVITFHIENSSYPNWIGQDQKRNYELSGDELTYRVTARPNGDIPISVWKRVN